MPNRLATLLDYLRTSLWPVPAAISAGAILFAVLALRIDVGRHGTAPVWWLHSGSARDASDLLETLLASLFTMTTLVISITMVVLTLAASQLGPRLLRSFMSDRRTQIVLGLFIATIVYVLLVLRTLNEALPADAVPHVAVTIASALALLCVFALLFFVHHLARSIVSDTVVQRVGAELDAAVRDLLPEAEDAPCGGTPGPAAAFRLRSGGYVQAIDYGGLVACARAAGAVLTLGFRAGQHLVPGAAQVRVAPPEALTPDLEAAVARAVLLGNERTPTQDIEYGVRQLVEIALRALSPGVNDPYTAIAVIDRLARTLAIVQQRGTEAAARCDADGVVRVIAPVSDFAGILDAAFNQIRQAGADKPDILIPLLEAIGGLLRVARDPDRREPLLTQARMIVEAGRRTLPEPRDRDAVEQRYRAALAEAGSPA